MESNQTVEDGHRWYTNKHGGIDYYYWDNDYHHGPMCKECLETPCTGCEANWKTELCPETMMRPFLPLEF